MSPQADQILIDTKQPAAKKVCWGNIGILFSTLAIFFIAAAFGVGYYQLSQVNIALARSVSHLQAQTTDAQMALSNAQRSLTDLQQASQNSQAISEKQERMMADWQAAQKGDLMRWYVAEAQYLVKLANDHVQFTHNLAMSEALLTRADQLLSRFNDSDVLEIRKSLANDIVNIRALPQIDTSGLYLHLNALNTQIDQLPLPAMPLKPEEKPLNTVASTPDESWWQVGLDRTLQTLRQIVIVRNNSNHSLPLVLPDEKPFLYQNLHAQMESAMWAVLHQNPLVYQMSLARMMLWTEQYFDKDAPATRAMIINLQELRKINLQPMTINLAESLQLFDAYFAHANQSQPNTNPDKAAK